MMMMACGITRLLTDRPEVEAELRGRLPKHDDNTVHKDKRGVGRAKLEKKRGIKLKHLEKKILRNKSDFSMKQQLMGLINHPACSLTCIIYTEQEQTAMVRLQKKKKKKKNCRGGRNF